MFYPFYFDFTAGFVHQFCFVYSVKSSAKIIYFYFYFCFVCKLIYTLTASLDLDCNAFCRSCFRFTLFPVHTRLSFIRQLKSLFLYKRKINKFTFPLCEKKHWWEITFMVCCYDTPNNLQRYMYVTMDVMT